MTTALIGVSWFLMLATFGLVGYLLVHFTARIDALEDELEALREPAAPISRPISQQFARFALEEDSRP